MKERNLNADLIRCVAVFSVVSVHFLKNNGFYSTPVDGIESQDFSAIFFICVSICFLCVCTVPFSWYAYRCL